MGTRLLTLTASLVCLGILACGCLEGSSALSTSTTGSTPTHGPSNGTIQGRVFTTSCGVRTCSPVPYRGSLTFCRKMGQIGFCPSARVDADGRYRIELRVGRYALVPAPGSGNTVFVTPRWVSVGMGETRTLDINGRSLTD